MSIRSVGDRRIRPVVALFASTISVSVAAGLYFTLGCSSSAPGPGSTTPTVRPPLPAGSYPTSPLAGGALAPPFEAAGWVNGPPTRPVAPGTRLIVLDVWAHWCPACRLTAPGVVRAYQKFKDRGVAFVSLTNVDREGVEDFVEQYDIPWPCGYGSPLEAIARFGAYSRDRMTENYNPGYEVSPTFYIFSADHRVLWHDGQARPRHLKDSETLIRELDAEIEHQLGRVGKG